MMVADPKPDYVYEAEAEESRAAARESDAIAARALAEAAKLGEETRAAKAVADVEEMLLREKRRVHEEVFAHNKFNYVYNFTSTVDEKSVKQCMDQLDVWRRVDSGKPITIVFTSPGGSVIDGLALWDYLIAMKADGVHLTTVARGYAASMAGILLQAGNERVIGAESYMLIHQISAAVMGSFGAIEDRTKWMERVQDRILDIFAARAKCSRAFIKKNWTRKDWWIDSEEALRLGLVDRIG